MVGMSGKWSKVWRVAKPILAVLIVGGVGWQFAKILRQPQLWERPIHPDPLGVSLAAGLYALGLGCWGGVWWRLVRACGEPLRAVPAARAYFVSQLGKYVPGKAWAI